MKELREILRKLDAILNLVRHPPKPPKPPHFRPDTCRFAGAYWINPKTGAITVATQQVPSNTAITAPLTFTQSSTGATGPGPVGQVSASDGSVVTLSASGQAINYTTGAPGVTVTILWHDPAGVIPDATVTLTDQPIPFVPDSVAIGTFVTGTTA